MTKIYPKISNQYVRIKGVDGKTKAKLTQDVTMVNTQAKDGKQTLLELTTKSENGSDKLMSIYSKDDETAKNKKSYFVKLDSLEKFNDEDEFSIENDETLKAIFSENGLEIAPDSNAISLKKSNEQIIITVNAEDKKPYTIIASPTSISFEYGDDKDAKRYIYKTNNEKCIDITLNRQVVADILSSKKGESVFNTISSITTLPANIVGEYFAGMEPNTTIEYNDTVLSKLNFGAETPDCCFVKQKNSKGNDVRYFYTEGQMVPCSGQVEFLYENGDDGKTHYSMHLQTSTKPEYYYYVPVPVDSRTRSAKAVNQFNQAYDILTSSALAFNTKNTENEQDSKQLTLFVDGKNENINSTRMDTRKSNAVSFTINDRRLAIQETVPLDKLYTSDDSESSVSSDNVGVVYRENANNISNLSDNSSGDDNTDDSDSTNNTQTSADGVTTESNTQAEQPDAKQAEENELYDEGGENTEDSDGGDSKNAKPEDNKKSNAETAKQLREKRLEEDKKILAAKNKAFKDNMKTFNNVMGETLSSVGIWLMVCSLIPGVGLLAMIPGAIIAGVGLFQTTFADKLVFSPYRRIKHKLEDYEAEQVNEFGIRDQFLERERELDVLENASAEKIAVLDKMYDKDLSENKFARDFASLYNTNGVGIATTSEGKNNILELNNLENLDTRIAMAMSLDQISKTNQPETRQALIEDFTTNYFSNLNANQRASVEELFNSNNDENLRQYIVSLNEANSAQIKERALYESQRETIKSADLYRLNYLASTEKLTEEQRIAFFDRYGTDIVQNAVLTHDGTTEVINEIIGNVPEESRDQVVSILSDAASQVNQDIEIIDSQVKENIEEHSKVSLLQEFKNSIDDIIENKDKIATIDSCYSANENYLKTYTLAYYNGYAEKLEENVLKDTPTQVSGTEGKVLSSVNEAMQMIKPANASSQVEAVDKALNKGGYIDKIANLYAASSENGESLLSGGGLLAEPTENKVEKNHTLYSIADTLAKNDLITYIVGQAGKVKGVEPEALRDTLNKKSITDIVSDYAVNVADNKNVSITIEGQTISSSNKTAVYAAAYSKSRIAYQNDKQARISDALTKITEQVTSQSSKTPLVQYDAKNKTYSVANYNTKPENEGKDNYLVYNEEALTSEYSSKYPYFATLSSQQKQQIIMLNLGVAEQKERLEAVKNRSIATGKTFNEANHETKLKVYDNVEKFVGTLLDGSFSVAYDERAYESVLDPEHKLGRDLSAAQVAGKELTKNIESYHNLNKIIEKLPVSVEEKKNIEKELSRAYKENNNLDFSKMLVEQVKPFMEREEVDGENMYDILADYTDINNPSSDEASRAENTLKFNQFCKDKNLAIDKRTSMNLTAVRARNGSKFVDKEYNTRKENIENSANKYATEVDLLSEILYDDKAGVSLVASIKTDSKEIFKEELAIKLDSAKSKSAREKLVLSLLPNNYKKEYKNAKKMVLDELPSKENIEYFKASQADRTFELNRAKFESNLDTLLTGNLATGDELSQTSDKIMKELVATGIDENLIDSLVKHIEDDSLSANKKRIEIAKIKKDIDRELDIQKLRLKNKKGYADAARDGETADARKTSAEEYNLSQFKKAKAKFDANLSAIEDYLDKNPNYPYGNEILDAFIKGDSSFFETYPDARPKGIKFENANLYMFELLGITDDIDKLSKEMNKPIDATKFTPEDVRKIRKNNLKEGLSIFEGLQDRIEIQEKRLEDQLNHNKASREGNSNAERVAHGDKEAFESYQKAEQEFSDKLNSIEKYIEEHPDYQYSSELINAFIDGDKTFFENHPEFKPKGLEFGNLDLYLFEKLDIDNDISKLKQKAHKKVNTVGLTSKDARVASEKAMKENKKLLEKFRKNKEKLNEKIRAKSISREMTARSSYFEAINKSTKTETDLSKINRTEAIAGFSGISKLLAKLKGERNLAQNTQAEAKAKENVKAVDKSLSPALDITEEEREGR